MKRSSALVASIGALGLAIILAACGSSSSSPPPQTLCNTGTLQQLANPTPGQAGVATNIGRIVIVADGSTNQLYNNPSQWDVLLTDTTSGSVITGGALTLVSGSNLIHPYPSDFYYASTIQQLVTGHNYTASLSQVSGVCTSVGLGSFST